MAPALAEDRVALGWAAGFALGWTAGFALGWAAEPQQVPASAASGFMGL